MGLFSSLFGGGSSSSSTSSTTTAVEGGGSALTGSGALQANNGIGLAGGANYQEQGAVSLSGTAKLNSPDISGQTVTINDPGTLNSLASQFASAVDSATANGAAGTENLAKAVMDLAAAQVATQNGSIGQQVWAFVKNNAVILAGVLLAALWIFKKKK